MKNWSKIFFVANEIIGKIKEVKVDNDDFKFQNLNWFSFYFYCKKHGIVLNNNFIHEFSFPKRKREILKRDAGKL